MIDAWRGLAALGVVFFHLGVGNSLNLGHNSVMVFFVISGYCIAASGESCRRNNVGPGGYMWRRLRRIYPPYFFSICFFVVTRLVKVEAGMGDQLSHSILVWIQNLTLTQWFTLLRNPRTYAFDNPALLIAGYWSLCYEEQFYIVIGLILFGAIYFKKPMLTGIVVLMVPALVWNFTHPSITYGFFLDYWIAFALGSLVFYRLCKASSFEARACIDLTIVCLLIVSLIKGGSSHTDNHRLVYSEWIVTTVFALVLIYARSLDRWFRKSMLGVLLCGFGLITYSLYLTHQCLLHASSIAADKLILLGIPRFTEFPVRVILICIVAAVFWYFCERPFLNKPLSNRSPMLPRNGV
jgi:peptidoglycan/LPS O-acetylase OafA/YrhL